MVQESKFIWLDGELVPWHEANVHVLTHSLHYGLGAFEGIRCYKRSDGRRAIFRLEEHVQRLLDSCKIATIESPFDHAALMKAHHDIVRENDLQTCYLRPLIFMGDGTMGLGATSNKIRATIVAWPWGSYLGDEGINQGIRTKVSSFTRPGVNSAMVRGKLTGQYINSILAKREALKGGYHEAILLDDRGYVAEGSGENIFMVKAGKVFTPPLTSPILAGITRDTVIDLMREMGLEVIESSFTRDDMYIADELFFTGTAAEVTPIREVDDRPVGASSPGSVTKRIQARYFDVVKGEDDTHPEWLSFVDE